MDFNAHTYLEGKHAFLGASNYHWINYDEEKLDIVYDRHKAKQKGTELHDVAARLVKLRINLPRVRKTLNMYVNDAIGYKMDVEQPLFYSVNCFGTADAISFRRNKLRIHDYKSGVTKASFHQLVIYAALFCLEYKIIPANIKIELRIYQNDEIQIFEPPVEDVLKIMEKIVAFDKRIEFLKEGAAL